MTTAALQKDLERELATLERQREAHAVNELRLEEQLRQARQNTAFVAGQITHAKMILQKLKEDDPK